MDNWLLSMFPIFSAFPATTGFDIALVAAAQPGEGFNLCVWFYEFASAHLTQLQISTLDYIDSQTWVKTFGKLPLLERVCVPSSAPESFLEVLVYKTKAAGNSKTAYRNVFFPKLRYIHLKGTDFFATSPMTTLVDMLLDYPMERCGRNPEVQVRSSSG